MITEKTVQGIKVSVCNKNLKNDGHTYIVFEDKIWRKIGSQGSGINYGMKVEQWSLNTGLIERWIFNEEIKNKVEYILTPSGYIDLERIAFKDDIKKNNFTK